MNWTVAVELGLQVAEWLQTNIPKWAARGRESGEYDESQEADYQQRQAAIFAKPYAQAETERQP